MSTKLTNPEERQEKTENRGEKNVPMSESCQPPDQSAQQRQSDGKATTVVMTEEQVSDLLARLQDILCLWPGSDNRIIGNYVMTAFPIPLGMEIGKVVSSNGHDKAFSVNGTSVVEVGKS